MHTTTIRLKVLKDLNKAVHKSQFAYTYYFQKKMQVVVEIFFKCEFKFLNANL